MRSLRTLSTACAAIAFLFLACGSIAHANEKWAIKEIENPAPPIRFDHVNYIWEFLKKRTGAPAELPPPPITLDWEVPSMAKMGFQYPTEEFPDGRVQISIAPRTLDMLEWKMTLWGLGHEMTHYLFIMRENGWDTTKKTFSQKILHHCNPEFIQVTRDLADRIWNIYHEDSTKYKMYDEAVKACGSNPGQ